MPSFPQPLIVRPVDLRVPSPLSRKTGTRSRMKPTLQRNRECPAVPPRHPQAHGAGWDPPTGREGAGSSDQHLPAALANWEVPADWKSPNVTHTYEKGWKEDVGNYRPVSLTSVRGKVMEEIILQAITECVQGKQGTRPSQGGFMKGRFCLTNLISSYDKVTQCMREKLWMLSAWTLEKPLAVSQSILLKNLAAHALDKQTTASKNLSGWLGPGDRG